MRCDVMIAHNWYMTLTQFSHIFQPTRGSKFVRQSILMIQEIRDRSGLVTRSPRTFLKPLLKTDASEVWELATIIKRPKVV